MWARRECGLTGRRLSLEDYLRAKAGGIFFAECPEGANEFEKAVPGWGLKPGGFHGAWGVGEECTLQAVAKQLYWAS